MKALPLLILNTVTFLLTLVINYLIGSGSSGERTVGEVSDLYPTLITPAGYAFAIWGIIYLFLLGYLGAQWVGYFNKRNEDSLLPSGIWFAASNIFNGLWVILWTNVAMVWSVLIISALLFSLIQLVIRLKLELWNAPVKIILFVWWPITIYTGWVVLATTLNISIWLNSINLLQNILTPEIWAIVVLAVASAVYVFLTFTRNMREAALVGVWGTIAIAVKQWEQNETVVYASLTAAVVLFLIAGYHAFKNATAPPPSGSRPSSL
nr:hypothetical protein [Cytophagales bacterium]